MPLDNRNLEPGTVLMARYKAKARTCEVVKTDDGLRYRLDDGTEYRSPSSAGKAAMGGIACNGWRFWSLQGSLKSSKTRKAKPAVKAASNKRQVSKISKSGANKPARKKSPRRGRGRF